MNQNIQYFVYYRVEPAHVEQAIACARGLFSTLASKQIATGQLYQRTETGKPYYTLMEVLSPAASAHTEAEDFLRQIQPDVELAFAELPVTVERHSEVFKYLPE
ncbi:DUF4936 family protein [Limnobacter sp.]|uniref:DUF4936 family protein n=1 Tax=Limnobacter sp. TaxID=2003368 RepID=UPI003517FE56